MPGVCLGGMLKLRFDWYITKPYERKLDATNFISSECTSASLRLGPSLYRGSTVALKSFNTENKADFPLLFRGFVIKIFPPSWKLQILSLIGVLNPQFILSGFKNFPVHTFSDSLRIYYFSLWRADSKLSRFAGCVWTERKSCGFKNIRIREDRALILGSLSRLKYWFTAALNWLYAGNKVICVKSRYNQPWISMADIYSVQQTAYFHKIKHQRSFEKTSKELNVSPQFAVAILRLPCNCIEKSAGPQQ